MALNRLDFISFGDNLNTGMPKASSSNGHARFSRESGESGTEGRYFEDGLTLEEIPTTSTHAAQPGIWNGQSIRACTLRECLQSRQAFYRDGDQLPPELAYLQIPKDEYKSAVGHIEGCSKVRHYSLCYNKWLHSCAFSLLFLFVWTLGFLLWISNLVTMKMGTGVFFLIAVTVVIVGVVTCKCARSRSNGRARKLLAKANEIFSRYHVIVGLVEEGMVTCYRLSMHFIYFDLGPCLESLAEDLGRHLQRRPAKNKGYLQRVSSISDTDLMLPSHDVADSKRQDLAKELLLFYCGDYVTHLVTGRLRMPRHPRHAHDAPCVCQFVHRQFFHAWEAAADDNHSNFNNV